ncbi:MAG: hypothetical protein ACYC1D_10040 [Acidimicrobiales bacterium]
MTRPVRGWIAGLMAAVVAITIPAGMAWACVGLALLTTTSPTVKPGGTATAIGRDFAPGSPVQIHLDSLTGPVLTTVPPLKGFAMTTRFKVPVSIPADITVGPHVLIATQDEHNMNTNVPARAVIYVGTAPSPPPAPSPRAATLSASSGPSVGVLALVALAVAAVALAVFGAVVAGASRRPRPEAVKGS